MEPNGLMLDSSFASLEGAEIARMVSIAFFGLTVYEWIITLDEEVKYFWKGPWTVSRALFFMNRYLPPAVMILGLVCFFAPNPSPEFCKPAIGISFVANATAIGIIQAILTVRVWYLFSGNRPLQCVIALSFLGALATSLYFTGVAARDLRILEPLNHITGIRIPGCRAARPDRYWRILLSSLALHTVLYALTAARALSNRRLLKEAPIMKRLLRDGGFFYFVVFFSVGFTAVGSFMIKNPQLNIPVEFSNYLLAINSIAVSRIMLSIRSLAARLGSDTAWLLNNVELARVGGWKQGATEGEIIVERWVDDADEPEDEPEDDDESVHGGSSRSIRSNGSIAGRATPLMVSRIGDYNHQMRVVV